MSQYKVLCLIVTTDVSTEFPRRMSCWHSCVHQVAINTLPLPEAYVCRRQMLRADSNN